MDLISFSYYGPYFQAFVLCTIASLTRTYTWLYVTIYCGQMRISYLLSLWEDHTLKERLTWTFLHHDRNLKIGRSCKTRPSFNKSPCIPDAPIVKPSMSLKVARRALTSRQKSQPWNYSGLTYDPNAARSAEPSNSEAVLPSLSLLLSSHGLISIARSNLFSGNTIKRNYSHPLHHHTPWGHSEIRKSQGILTPYIHNNSLGLKPPTLHHNPSWWRPPAIDPKIARLTYPVKIQHIYFALF